MFLSPVLPVQKSDFKQVKPESPGTKNCPRNFTWIEKEPDAMVTGLCCHYDAKCIQQKGRKSLKSWATGRDGGRGRKRESTENK